MTPDFFQPNYPPPPPPTYRLAKYFVKCPYSLRTCASLTARNGSSYVWVLTEFSKDISTNRFLYELEKLIHVTCTEHLNSNTTLYSYDDHSEGAKQSKTMVKVCNFQCCSMIPFLTIFIKMPAVLVHSMAHPKLLNKRRHC